jgi:hypothetical protein
MGEMLASIKNACKELAIPNHNCQEYASSRSGSHLEIGKYSS